MPTEKIEVLRLEYQFLTDEIKSRTKARFAFAGLIFALLGFLVKEGICGPLDTHTVILAGLISRSNGVGSNIHT